jgi:hypothetical protein
MDSVDAIVALARERDQTSARQRSSSITGLLTVDTKRQRCDDLKDRHIKAGRCALLTAVERRCRDLSQLEPTGLNTECVLSLLERT